MQETAKQIASKGGTAFAYKCDVSNSEDVKLAAARVRQNLDHVDIVVSSAKTICAKLRYGWQITFMVICLIIISECYALSD